MDTATALYMAARTDDAARLVLADYWEGEGRPDVAMLYRDELPTPKAKRRKRVTKLTPAEIASLPEWAEKWIKIGLCTEPADRPLFEAAVSACYRYSGLVAPRVIWCESPIVAVMAGPLIHQLLCIQQVDEQACARVDDQVDEQVRARVGDQVDQVCDQVGKQVCDQMDAQVYQVCDQVDEQVRARVGEVGERVCAQVQARVQAQVDDQEGEQVRARVGDQVDQVCDQVGKQVCDQMDAQVYQVQAQVDKQVRERARNNQSFNQPGYEWWRIFGGQFWAGWYWYGSPAVVSCFMDMLRLDIGRDIELRARAYIATTMSACWWWPHQDFVCVSERPQKLISKNGKLVLAKWNGWEVKPK